MVSASINPVYQSVAGLLIIITLLFSDSNSVQGNIECEELPVQDCAFAVASSGARCVLEKHVSKNGRIQYKCQTSIIMAERGAIEWIETDACIRSCGLTRLSVGLSSDALLERPFIRGICSTGCRSRCPNILDLYTKLAAEEGVYLPKLCDSFGASKPHRMQMGSSTTQKQDLVKGKISKVQSLQEDGRHPLEPPYDAKLPYPPMYGEPPYPLEFPHNHDVEPPYPLEPPHDYDAEPPYPSEFPHDHDVEPPYPLEPPHEAESPYAEPPYVAESPYSYVPPYLEPPYSYGESPYPDFPPGPIYTQPEPTLVAPSLPPSYFSGY